MRAITIRQPWATLVVRGLKRFETRTWRWTPRHPSGVAIAVPLAIHAAKAYDVDERQVAEHLVRVGLLDTVDLPRGAVVGTVTYIRGHWSYPETRAELGITFLEFELGDLSDGRILWEFADPVEFEEPIPATGRLGVWEWPGA